MAANAEPKSKPKTKADPKAKASKPRRVIQKPGKATQALIDKWKSDGEVSEAVTEVWTTIRLEYMDSIFQYAKSNRTSLNDERHKRHIREMLDVAAEEVLQEANAMVLATQRRAAREMEKLTRDNHGLRETLRVTKDALLETRDNLENRCTECRQLESEKSKLAAKVGELSIVVEGFVRRYDEAIQNAKTEGKSVEFPAEVTALYEIGKKAIEHVEKH